MRANTLCRYEALSSGCLLDSSYPPSLKPTDFSVAGFLALSVNRIFLDIGTLEHVCLFYKQATTIAVKSKQAYQAGRNTSSLGASELLDKLQEEDQDDKDRGGLLVSLNLCE